MPKPPLLRQSGLTGNWYIVTGYRELTDGNIVAGVKHDATAAVLSIQAAAWQEGYTSGHSRAMRRMSDEPDVKPAKNPYRKGDK